MDNNDYLIKNTFAKDEYVVIDKIGRLRPGQKVIAKIANPTSAKAEEKIMFSQYFIERPRFAAVISIIMVLVGVLAIFVLPVSQYPQITPPQIVVSAVYPGANAKVLVDTVAVPIEKELIKLRICSICPPRQMTTPL